LHYHPPRTKKFSQRGEQNARHKKTKKHKGATNKLLQIHKMPLKTRPIISVSGSLLHALGRWLNEQLHPLIRSLPSFIASSWELKTHIEKLSKLPANTRLFTCNMVSVYASIDTGYALDVTTSQFSSKSRSCHNGPPAKAIIAGLELIMCWNIFKLETAEWHRHGYSANFLCIRDTLLC
jgi:hypothetical protein